MFLTPRAPANLQKVGKHCRSSYKLMYLPPPICILCENALCCDFSMNYLLYISSSEHMQYANACESTHPLVKIYNDDYYLVGIHQSRSQLLCQCPESGESCIGFLWWQLHDLFYALAAFYNWKNLLITEFNWLWTTALSIFRKFEQKIFRI